MTSATLLHSLGTLLIIASLPFFLAGTIGLLRFPDVYTRLHALGKADNVGLGLICLGLALHSGSALAAGKLLLIWLLVLVAAATGTTLIARTAHSRGLRPWTRR